LSVPLAAPYPDIEGDWLTEWGGGLRWLVTAAPPDRVRAEVHRLGGHAHLFSARGGFEPLPAALMQYHARLKAAFDPDGLFNPGRFPLSA
jgi:glycolate oxidase FAD binding subunit